MTLSLNPPISEALLTWPSISEELEPYLKYCQGIVLNAGSGRRNIQLGQKDLNIDIVPDNQPDVIADLHCIPLQDETVDTIVCLAVLEHTRYPWIVAQEFFRVLRSGGYGVIAVPFLQPQHACPNDYVRFTENGLVELMNHVGFEVIESASVHHFGQTLAWLLVKYFEVNKPRAFMQPFWSKLIHQLSQGKVLKGDSPDTHNTHYIVVRKPGEPVAEITAKFGINPNSKTWFYPLLCCPQTKQPLQFQDKQFVSKDGQLTYPLAADGVPCLVPTQPERETNETSRLFSEENFKIKFKPDFRKKLVKSADKVALLATPEYEGLSKNGGIGTYYTALSQKLSASGWYVILLLCQSEESFQGDSTIPALRHVFSSQEVEQVLALQPLHMSYLAAAKQEDRYIDYQSLCAFLFTQALCNHFKYSQVYVEFPETWGLGYRTIQAKKAGLLGSNCVTAVTMHSGHEWIYEANEAFVVQFPPFFWRLYHYEQYSLENADLSFFPSHFLKSKVESYSWQTGHTQHMPYFVPTNLR